MRKKYLECGKVVSVHGLRGDVRVQPWCDSPGDLTGFATLYLEKGEVPMAVEKARVQKNMVLLKFRGVDTPEAAQALRGKVLYLDREDDTLEEGQHYVQDLLGMTVADADTGRVYGVLRDVSRTGANDVYHVEFPDGAVELVPAIPQVVVRIDIEAGRMEIRPLEGLFDHDTTV